MLIKDIRIHIDHSKTCDKRIEAGAMLANRFDAHLTGVYVKETLTIPVYAEIPIGEEVISRSIQALQDYADEAKAHFLDLAGKHGVSAEWLEAEGELISVLRNDARYSDLMILGQHNPDDQDDRSGSVADHLVLEAGVPCLVIPYIGVTEPFAMHPVVAWNGSHEATRAVHDALPLIESAKKVTVVVINPDKIPVNMDDLPGAMISQHLARHDINVDLKTLNVAEIGASEALLSLITDEGADLIVMGAYGHSRFRELVLGGMTRDILKHMTVPVLMSH
ncbi:MAG: universal stress protein [Pseudomonadota bacterium]|nr:universal stress protein [Pseudomonadota bacterium]